MLRSRSLSATTNVGHIVQKFIFILTCVPILVGPWFFGSRELWWFWPFTLCIFMATMLFGIQQFKRSLQPSSATVSDDGGDGIWLQRQRNVLLLSLPLLVYAIWWLTQPIVYMLAETSVLLLVTSVLLAAIIIFGITTEQRQRLFIYIILNLFLLGLYGIINHAITDSRIVLWTPGYEQYMIDHRATGSYFCPNHFSGIMEIATAMGLGVFLTRRVSHWQRALGLSLVALACVAVVLSKSRGGGLTLLLIFVASLHWGFANWPRRARWWWRAAGVAMGGILVTGMILVADGFMGRYEQYVRPDLLEGLSVKDASAALRHRIEESSRGRMFAGAFRAWQSAPVIGIGPGMHTTLWPHFAAETDGDAIAAVWPTRSNHHFWSDEVHSDWLEMLEEYGLTGLILLLIPVTYLFFVLSRALRQDRTIRRERKTTGTHLPREAMALGAILAFIAMAFHSLADFNLQMPATVWLLSAILALPIGMMGEKRVRSSRS
ncbi:MAG: O-antigen ligase [Candidatus Promineifilaceae bacterium]|jgi:O-antigen ligase